MIWNLATTVIKGVVDVVKTKTETKKNMAESWRDEWFTIILSIPLLIVFGAIFFNQPDWIIKLKEGFIALDELPDWYIWALMASIASSFGLKVSDLAIKKFKK